MKVLVVGTGAREHAIADALKDDVELYCYMSKVNPGISKIAEFAQGDEGEIEKVAKFAVDNNIDIAFIGPEAPLGKGIVDELEKNGISCVGPSQSAARIETDKSFMRKLFEDYDIEGSLVYKVFDNYDDVSAFLDDFDRDVVVKPVGLTGGKGVKIVGDHLKDNQEAKEYSKEVIDNAMGGFTQVIIEERLIGEEFTIQAFCDGTHLAPMPAAQDHPHAFEGDVGAITGGMGSYSDKGGLLPFLSQDDYDEAVKIMEATLKAIAKEAEPYKGILYGQFMLTADGPKLIEYNARFGDPEAMNVLPLLKTPLADVCQAIVDGNLDKVEFNDKASVCKYIVPEGYPETSHGGELIEVDERAIEELGAKVFYAAVGLEDDGIHLSGSRALGIVADGDSIEEAEKITKDAGLDVYDQVKKIQPICFENACWAYTIGAAIAIKKGCKRAADAAAAIGEGLQAFCIPGSVADHRKVGLGHGNLGKMLLEEETECFCFLAGHESFAAAEGAIGIAEKANKVRQKPLRVILNGLGKDAAQIISRINGFTFVETQYDYKAAKLNVVYEKAYSNGLRATVKCYGADDVQEGVAIMHHENVGVSITGNSTNPTRFQHPVAGTYKKECIEQGKKYFSVASGGGTGRTLHPDNMAAGPASYGMTDTMGRMHSDAQFAGSSSVPAHVEMMGLIGMGNNPMVGATVAVAVSVEEAAKAGKF